MAGLSRRTTPKLTKESNNSQFSILREESFACVCEREGVEGDEGRAFLIL